MNWLIENWLFTVFVIAVAWFITWASVRLWREHAAIKTAMAELGDGRHQDQVARNKFLKEQIARQRTNHELFERFKPMLRATFIDGRTLGKYQMHAIAVDGTFGQLSLVMKPVSAGEVIEVGPSEFATFFNPVAA